MHMSSVDNLYSTCIRKTAQPCMHSFINRHDQHSWPLQCIWTDDDAEWTAQPFNWRDQRRRPLREECTAFHRFVDQLTWSAQLASEISIDIGMPCMYIYQQTLAHPLILYKSQQRPLAWYDGKTQLWRAWCHRPSEASPSNQAGLAPAGAALAEGEQRLLCLCRIESHMYHWHLQCSTAVRCT